MIISCLFFGFIAGTVGAAIQQFLRQATFRAQVELVVQYVPWRTHNQLLPNAIHPTGNDASYNVFDKLISANSSFVLFQASTFQMAVLLQFNEETAWSIKQLGENTGIGKNSVQYLFCTALFI